MTQPEDTGTDGTLWALGAMSGTSLDGVDAAMLRTDGTRIMAFGPTAYRPYTAEEGAALHDVLGRWPGPGLEAAASVLERAHLDVLSRFEGAELVGIHGQTLAHEPRGRGTHQLGDGAALAAALGTPVVWDFRTEDVRAGGEGAPLAPFFHFACARHVGATGPIAFLNLGGVGNLTWIDPTLPAPEAAGALLAFDTGPANAPINDLMSSRRGESSDRDGALAAKGRVARDVVAAFLEDDYFGKAPPKSLDRGDFPTIPALVAALHDADAAATLTSMSAEAVRRGLALCPAPPERLLVTGGGRHNPVLMAMLAEGLDCPVAPVEAVGLDGDMLEAQAFAFLAVRVLRGLPTSCPGTTGVRAPVSGGRVSRPAELRRSAG